MEEELLKRNTDCVYFLASPLTCKKGSECEYRHSEMARLNPRDCWYWMSGSCLNPSCAFRHPPLDAQSQTSSEPALNQPAVAAVPVNKTNAPCYFFHNGFCNKGEKCSYMHGPFDNVSTWKPSKSDPVNPDGLPAEKKASAGSDTGSAPIATHATSFKTGHQQAARIKKAPHPEIHQPAPNNVAEQNASPLTPVSQYEDSIAGRSISPLAAAGSFQRRSHTSSPGFDVLVDNGLEELDCEEDYEYVPDHDREGRDLNARRHDYEENAEDDLAYPASSILYEKRRRDYEDHAGAELHYAREGAANSRGSVLDRIMPRKRTLPRELSSNGQDSSVDLRDILKRRRMVDDHSRNHSSRRLESSRLISRSRERPQSYSERRLHERRDSRSENTFSRSRLEDGGRLRYSPFDRSRLQEKPQLHLSEFSGKAASRLRSYDEDSAMFTGPKTLVAIIDEKRAKEDGDPSERSSSLGETVQENFRGPKTLQEILEEKRRSGSVEQGNNDRN